MLRRGILSSIRHVLEYKLTPFGRMLVLVMFVAAVGSVTVELPIYYVFCLLSSVLFVAEVVGILMQPRLRAKVWLPPNVAAGEVLHGRLTIENLGRWPAYDVMCAVPGLPEGIEQTEGHVMIPVLPAGKSAVLPVSFQTASRGIYPLPPFRPHSTFPLNVMRFGKTAVDAAAITVLPAFHPLEQIRLPAASRHQPGGVLIEGHIGSSPEYVGNREYTPGEPINRLDFRAWARLGRPVIREYHDEYCTRIAIILDTYQPNSWFGSKKSRADFEAAVSLTAALANSLQSTEAIVELFAAGPELYVFRTTTQSIHFEKLLEILAGVESTSRNPFEELSPAVGGELETVSTVLSVLLNWDETREEFVRMVADAGCESKVILVRDHSPTTIPFPEDGEDYQRVSPRAIQRGEVTRL